MTVKEFLNIANIVTPDSFDRLSEVKKPRTMCGKETPDTINGLTFGELIRLQDIKDVHDMLFVPGNVLMRIKDSELMLEEFENVIGLANWTGKEIDRVSRMFAKTSVSPTQEEKKAGIERMNFGTFGIIDYYAQRMGISNHEDVESVPWVRVYKCLDMDAQRIRFNRRLRKIFQEQNKK